MSIASINPATGKKEKVYAAMTHEEINAKLLKAQKAFIEWKTVSITKRALFMKKAAENLRANKKKICRSYDT